MGMTKPQHIYTQVCIQDRSPISRQAGRLTDRQRERKAGRRTERQAGRQTARQMDTQADSV